MTVWGHHSGRMSGPTLSSAGITYVRPGELNVYIYSFFYPPCEFQVGFLLSIYGHKHKARCEG